MEDSLHESFSINMRSTKRIKATHFPSLQENDEDVDLTILRKQQYLNIWATMEKRILQTLSDIDVANADLLLEFLMSKKDASFDQIKTAVVLGGYNGSDQVKFYKDLVDRADQNGISNVVLNQLDGSNIKDCMKKILNTLAPSTGKKTYSDFDIERLEGFTGKINVVIPTFETFPPAVLQKVAQMFHGRKSLDVTFMFGISTNLECLHQALSKGVLSKLNIRLFQLEQTQECYNQIVIGILLDPLLNFKLGAMPYWNLLDRFHLRDLSVTSFIRGIKYALMTFYYATDVAVLLCEVNQAELNENHYLSLRLMPSFLKYWEEEYEDADGDDDIKRIKTIMVDDDVLYEWSMGQLAALKKYHQRLKAGILVMKEMQDLFHSKTVKKPVRTMYGMALLNGLTDGKNDHIDLVLSLFRVLTMKDMKNFIMLTIVLLSSDGCNEDFIKFEELLQKYNKDLDNDSEESSADNAEKEKLTRDIKSKIFRSKTKRKTNRARLAGSASLDYEKATGLVGLTLKTFKAFFQ